MWKSVSVLGIKFLLCSYISLCLWIPVLWPWAQILARHVCPVHEVKDLNSICFHQFLIRRGIQTWKTALKLGLCSKATYFLNACHNFPIFVCSRISQGCVPAAHWLMTLAFSVLNQRHVGCFPGGCPCPPLPILSSGCCSSRQLGLPPSPWCIWVWSPLLPVYLTLITANPFTWN